jgi:hypothetical protein
MENNWIQPRMTYYGFHKPSKENWVILGIDQVRRQAAGWPASIGDLDDIEGLTSRKERTIEEEVHVTKNFGVSFLN